MLAFAHLVHFVARQRLRFCGEARILLGTRGVIGGTYAARSSFTREQSGSKTKWKQPIVQHAQHAHLLRRGGGALAAGFHLLVPLLALRSVIIIIHSRRVVAVTVHSIVTISVVDVRAFVGVSARVSKNKNGGAQTRDAKKGMWRGRSHKREEERKEERGGEGRKKRYPSCGRHHRRRHRTNPGPGERSPRRPSFQNGFVL